MYLKDDAEQTEFLAGHKGHNKDFQRLKGLGEMDFEELRDTTIDPEQRSTLQITMEEVSIADQVCSVLMGDDVAVRRHFIQANAKDVRFSTFRTRKRQWPLGQRECPQNEFPSR